ncbi:hypothetical protein H072_6709 [Dactylellina haptotyla CBS 200.50]|uniref:F-box domain-containing protein n=1 Tax=Dactylellina haptotyla (strain CBS 200.50) TaxID=1284197 RepID=S8A9D1_DACHA|nr:hypothetical protein H072_6709 [Dactylellina haptotyla CBS 200.50]
MLHRSPLLIPELAELVFVSLPAFELLSSCRAVCRLWRDVIDSSPVVEYYTWRSSSIPGRLRPKINQLNFQRNPVIPHILSKFWQRVNQASSEPPQEEITGDNKDNKKTPKKKAPLRKNELSPPLDTEALIAPFRKICESLIFANSDPIEVNIKLSTQKYASKHMLHRHYRTVATDYGIGWVTDLSILETMLEEIISLYNEKVYIPGKKNSFQAEIRYCVFLFDAYFEPKDEDDKPMRRELEITERFDFQCVEPWFVQLVERGARKREEEI